MLPFDTYSWHQKGSYLHILTMRWSREKLLLLYMTYKLTGVCVCPSRFKLPITWMPVHIRKSCLSFVSYRLKGKIPKRWCDPKAPYLEGMWGCFVEHVHSFTDTGLLSLTLLSLIPSYPVGNAI